MKVQSDMKLRLLSFADRKYALLASAVAAALFAFVGTAALAADAPKAPLATITVQPGANNAASAYDGVVEAVRQTVVAAQVQGAIIELTVKVGERVKAGQVLLRIDARAADQNVAANDAQVQAARAQLDVAAKDFDRQKQLFQKAYISAAALERAESQFKSTQAQVNAQIAQTNAARAQTGFNVIRAPYAGVVSEVPVTLGDMAMPGRALITLYDPAQLRVTASVPQSALSSTNAAQNARAEIPGGANAQQQITPTRTQVLPTVDAATHTSQIRLDLPSELTGITPGMFARVWLATNGSAEKSTKISVPTSAIVRRAEMTGLYVLNANGQPLLRQVRIGRADGANVEVLSGLMAGDKVATDPQAAMRVR